MFFPFRSSFCLFHLFPIKAMRWQKGSGQAWAPGPQGTAYVGLPTDARREQAAMAAESRAKTSALTSIPERPYRESF